MLILIIFNCIKSLRRQYCDFYIIFFEVLNICSSVFTSEIWFPSISGYSQCAAVLTTGAWRGQKDAIKCCCGSFKGHNNINSTWWISWYTYISHAHAHMRAHTHNFRGPVKFFLLTATFRGGFTSQSCQICGVTSILWKALL